MSEWKETTIGELITLQRGHDLVQTEFIDGEYLVAGSNGPIGSHNKFTAKGPGLTIGRSGNSIGVAHFYEKDFWAHNTVLYSKAFHHSYPKFVYFLLKSFDFKAFNAGSAVPTLNRNHVHPTPIKVPTDLIEQKNIADILTSLDDKINLLTRQNKTLEQLTETIFRQWLVEEVEEGCDVDKLGNVFDIGIGRTPPRKEHHWFSTNPNDIKWVSIKDMGISGIYIDKVSEYLTKEAVERFNIPVIPENTVMLSFKMTIGRLAISTENMLSNEAIAHFKHKENSILFPEFLYLFLKTFRWAQLGSTSSIVEAINSQMIKDIEMIIPDETNLKNFKDLIKPSFAKIKTNQNQIRILIHLRDTLLPKLISGEVRIENINDG